MNCLKMKLTAYKAFRMIKKARHNYKIRDKGKQATYAYKCTICGNYHITTLRSQHTQYQSEKRIKQKKLCKNLKSYLSRSYLFYR